MGIYKRGKSGIYYMDFYWYDEQGGNHRQFSSCRTKSKQKALRVQAQKRKELKSQHNELTLASMTLSAAAERAYDEVWAEQKDGDKPLKRIANLVEELGNIELSQIDSTWIYKMLKHLSSQGSSPATQNRYMAHIKMILRRARDHWGIPLRVPKFQMRNEGGGRIKVITEEEEQHAIDFFLAKGHQLMADLLVTLVDTGMRLGEALAIRYGENIDLNQRVIHLFADQTKSSKPRSLPMTKRVHEILTRRFKENALAFPISIHTVEGHWKRYKKINELTEKSYVLHAFRHTCASRLIRRGVDLYTVAKVLGHSSTKVTEKYAHLDVDTIRKAMEVLEE